MWHELRGVDRELRYSLQRIWVLSAFDSAPFWYVPFAWSYFFRYWLIFEHGDGRSVPGVQNDTFLPAAGEKFSDPYVGPTVYLTAAG